MENLERNVQRARYSKLYYLSLLFLFSASYFFGAGFKALHEGIFNYLMPVILLFFYFLFVGNWYIDIKNFFLLIVSSLIIVFSYLVVGGGIGSVLNNLSCILYIFIFYKMSFSQKDMKFFLFLLTFFHVFLFAYTFLNEYEHGYVGIYNANTISMQVFMDIILFNLCPSRKKMILFLQNITGIIIILFLRSRTALIASIVLFILLLWNKKFEFKKKVMKVFFWIMVAMGVVIPMGYVWLYQNHNSPFVDSLTKYSLQYFNKIFFTGRERIWEQAFDKLFSSKINFFLGIGSHFMEGRFETSNFHNSFFTIIICCGFLGYLFIMYMLYRLFLRNLKEGTTLSIRANLVYLSVMVVGFFESTLFSGHFAILGYLILTIGNLFSSSKIEN